MNNWPIKLSLFINYFVLAILLNSVGTVILQVQTNYGVSASDAAILEAFKDLSIMFTSFIAASFLVKVGYRNSMLIGMAIVSIATFITPSFPAFWMNKAMLAATGISFALIKIGTYSSLSLISDNKRDHASFINFIESFFMIGVLSGFFIFSWFIDDKSGPSNQWLNAYYVLGVLSTCAFVFLLFAKLDESQLETEEKTSIAGDFIAMFKLAIMPLVMVFVICAFLYVMIEQSLSTWLPTFNSSILNLSTSLSIQMASILALTTALGRFLAGILLKKIDWFWVLFSALILAAGLVLLNGPLTSNLQHGAVIDSWSNAPLAAFLFPCIGLCLAPIYPAINSAMLTALPIRQHAAMSGLIILFSALGGTTGSLVTGTLFEKIGGSDAFALTIVPIIGLLIALFFFKQQINRIQPTPN